MITPFFPRNIFHSIPSCCCPPFSLNSGSAIFKKMICYFYMKLAILQGWFANPHADSNFKGRKTHKGKKYIITFFRNLSEQAYHSMCSSVSVVSHFSFSSSLVFLIYSSFLNHLHRMYVHVCLLQTSLPWSVHAH